MKLIIKPKTTPEPFSGNHLMKRIKLYVISQMSLLYIPTEQKTQQNKIVHNHNLDTYKKVLPFPKRFILYKSNYIFVSFFSVTSWDRETKYPKCLIKKDTKISFIYFSDSNKKDIILAGSRIYFEFKLFKYQTLSKSGCDNEIKES